MRSTKFWIGLLAALAVVSAGAIALTGRLHAGDRVARIYQDGVCIREIDLARLEEPVSFSVEWEGRTNTVEAQEGRIRVSGAACPDQICVGQGWISDGVTPIVCLPNRLVIEIAGGGEEIDAATG